MIKIHKEGRLIVTLAVIIATALVVLAYRYISQPWHYLPSALVLAGLILVLRFFRVPSRRPFLDETSVVAPADGKVVAIERVHQPEFLNAESLQISIFMSIHDVHINYYPVTGSIQYAKYHPGQYLLARHPKSSEANERTSVGISTPHGQILVRQVAGYVARRIRCYADAGQQCRQGKEMGFIRFGSRLDLFLPPDSSVQVDIGQRVMGSVTPVARFKTRP